jgi:glucose-1-phosphate thymidylyltransferase
MVPVNGLILAATFSPDDDLAYRLQGRSRYALPLANRVLVRYAAEALVAVGVQDVAVAVSGATAADVAELIGDGSRFGARFRYLDLGAEATVLQTLAAAHAELGAKPLIVHAGDALVSAGLRQVVTDFQESQPDVLLVSERTHSYLEPTRAGVRGTERRDPQLGGLDHVAPAAIISLAALHELEGFTADTPTLGGTVAALAEAGMEVTGRALDGCWCYAPDCDHLLEANRMLLDELPHIPPEAAPETVRIEGRVAIHPTARIERTTIRGPAVIGGDAEVLDTFIGPYTSVGAEVRLEGAEIEHSIIMEGTRIQHVGQRIEGSLIGSGADITRDFGMPTAVRLRVGRGSSVTLA